MSPIFSTMEELAQSYGQAARLSGCSGARLVLQSRLLLCLEISFSLPAQPLALEGSCPSMHKGPECLRGVSLSSLAASAGFGSGKSGLLMRKTQPSPEFDRWTLHPVLLLPKSGCSELAGGSRCFRRESLSAFLPLLQLSAYYPLSKDP